MAFTGAAESLPRRYLSCTGTGTSNFARLAATNICEIRIAIESNEDLKIISQADIACCPTVVED